MGGYIVIIIRVEKLRLKYRLNKIIIYLDPIFGGAASQYTGLPARLPVCQFQLASGEVSLTILVSNIVGDSRRVFYNYSGTKNEQCHTQRV